MKYGDLIRFKILASDPWYDGVVTKSKKGKLVVKPLSFNEYPTESVIWHHVSQPSDPRERDETVKSLLALGLILGLGLVCWQFSLLVAAWAVVIVSLTGAFVTWLS